MLTATLVARAQERRGLLAGLVAAAVLAAYAWPLVDGTSGPTFIGADGLLRLAAATAVGQACLSAVWRREGRDRAAMLLLLAGAQVWAVVQAVHLARFVLEGTGELAVLDLVGSLALSSGAAAGLWLLAEPPGGRAGSRQAVEWSLLAVSVFLLLSLVLSPVLDGLGTSGLAGACVLVAASLLSLVRDGTVRRSWPLLPEGLAVVGAGLAADALPASTLGSRTAGVVLTGGLVLVASALALGDRSPHAVAADSAVRRRSLDTPLLWTVPLAAVAAALPDLLGTGRPQPLAVVGIVTVGLLAVAQGHLVAVEARTRVRALAEAEAHMRHRAFHDELTGLPNRALFLDRLTHALDLHRRHRTPLSVLYGDLDGFKPVNDRHGHATGDALLGAIARRLRECLRPEDTLARLGGDEFVLLLEQDSSPDVVADRVQQVLCEPFEISDQRFDVRMSIGIARVAADRPTPSPHEVLERADADMYDRKQSGRTGAPTAATATQLTVGSEPAAPAQTVPDPVLAAALARALHSGEVRVVYQPLVDASTGAVYQVEALARWAHDGHVVLPEAFVALAERFGLSGTLTDVVLEQSCAQLRQWSAAAGHHRLSMAVNVTASQIGDPTLPQRVREAARRHGLQQEQVVMETTVAALAEAPRTTAKAAADELRLSVSGFHGHPDDFALLTDRPVRAVKLSAPLTPGDSEPDDDRLLQVLVALGRELDVRVVVERVERVEELAVLRQLSGVLAQGNLLSRPAEAATLDEMVLRGCPLPA